MRINLGTDPAVRAIARELKIDVFGVVGRLHALWSWADEHANNGEIPFGEPNDVDVLVGMKGFASALVRVGWLDISTDSILFPNFDRHNGASAKKRALDTERKRLSRNQQDTEICPPSVRDLSASETDKSVTREEKRREEKSNTKTLGKNLQAAEAAPTLSDEDWLKGLAENAAYSTLDVPREHAKMCVWCSTHGKQPTRRRFVNWLNRCEKPMNAAAAPQAQRRMTFA